MIRSAIFKIVFYLGLITICLIFLPSLILPKKVASYGGKLTGHWAFICLKLIMSVNVIIEGKENLQIDKKFFIACTHQSAFETFYLQTIFNSPFFILKKELIDIPIFGWYLKKIGCVSIKRNITTRDNLDFFDNLKKSILSANGPLIIFPQGTRVSFNERPDFKKGTSRIYDLNLTCLPVVINSGVVWPKSGNVLPNRDIKISILNPIAEGAEKRDFIKNLQNLMYRELDRLV